MKTLTVEEIIFVMEKLCEHDRECLKGCPFTKECLYYYTGEKCGSALEIDNEKEGDKQK